MRGKKSRGVKERIFSSYQIHLFNEYSLEYQDYPLMDNGFFETVSLSLIILPFVKWSSLAFYLPWKLKKKKLGSKENRKLYRDRKIVIYMTMTITSVVYIINKFRKKKQAAFNIN